MLSELAAALLVGLSIAAPVGPIGLLVIQRTLQRGSAVGLATGLGAAADGLYGAIGAFGVNWLMQALQAARVPLALAGGAFLLALAWRCWTAAPAAQAARTEGARGLLGSFAGTFMLTLANPATILSFIAIFGSLGARAAGPSPELMMLGVLLGSALWWLLLSMTVGRLRTRFDRRWQRRVNRASALLLAGFAIWQWGGLIET
ncbi:MAG: LysE family transporter [Rubrivivax sp.]|nr:LysE family transporter [Rubrivivax sp.]